MERCNRMWCVLAIAAWPGCLELDPKFIREADTGESDATEGENAEGTDSGAFDCTPDAWEPSSYDDPADPFAGAPGTLRLEGPDAEDWYKVDLVPEPLAEVFARTPETDLRVCFFVQCVDATAATITKCSGEPAVDPAWQPGCCATSTVGLEYECGVSSEIVAFVRVDEGDHTCPFYMLDIGITPST